MIRKPFYRKFRKGFYETLSEKGASVLRYRGADNKEHYIAAGNSANVMPGGGMVETTWAELKALRDAGKLVAGQLYRITDYTTTTAQEMTQAAGHDFDVIVLALGSRSLSEDAWAAPREGDGYFCYYEREDGERMSVEEVEALAEQLGAELPPRREDKTMYWPEKLVLRWEETLSPGMITVEGHGSGMIGTTPYFDLFAETPYYEVTLPPIAGEKYFVDSLTPTPGVSRIYKGTYNLKAQRWVYTETDWVVATFTPGEKETRTETFTKKNALNRWRLRYCLDNDKSRFAWADDSVDEGSPASMSFIFDGTVIDCFRHTDGDGGENHPFGWITEDEAVVCTDTQIPNNGDNVYDGPGSSGQVISTVLNYTPAHEGTELPNGRGVIYRLIDEWGNSLPFDFKNIKLDYEESGEYAFVFGGPEGDESMDGKCFYVTMEDCFDSSMYIPIVRFTSCNNIRLGYDFAGEVANCNYVDVGDGCNFLLEDVNNVTYANDGGRVLTENNYSEIINASNS